MSYKRCSSFSGTEWAWESIIRVFTLKYDTCRSPYFSGESIISLDQALEKPSKKWSGIRIRQKLLPLQDWLKKIYSNDVDPIKYLIYLYYQEELTTHEVLARCQEIGFPMKTQWWFHKFLTATLWWELRDNKEMTKKRKRKISSPNSPAIIALKRNSVATVQKNTERFEATLMWIIEIQDTKVDLFCLETLNSIEDKYEKAFYILKVFEWITLDVLKQISRKTWLWATSITRIINSKLENIHNENSDTVPLIQLHQSMIHKKMYT